jgi:hypothetical protein
MSDPVVGNCLELYLQNYALIGSIEQQESLPPELKKEEQLMSSFGEKARDQASALLEGLHSRLLAGGALPYRVQRRSQRRTVREQWRMDGTFLLPGKKTPRNFWSLYLGCLQDKGPAACLVLGPNDPDSPIAIDAIASQAATLLGVESANARTAFSHDSSYECGVIVGFAGLSAPAVHEGIGATMRECIEKFFAKNKSPFEQALDASS